MNILVLSAATDKKARLQSFFSEAEGFESSSCSSLANLSGMMEAELPELIIMYWEHFGFKALRIIFECCRDTQVWIVSKKFPSMLLPKQAPANITALAITFDHWQKIQQIIEAQAATA